MNSIINFENKSIIRYTFNNSLIELNKSNFNYKVINSNIIRDNNLIKSRDRKIDSKKAPIINDAEKLHTLVLQLNNSCNLSCKYCYGRYETRPQESNMEINIIKQSVINAAEQINSDRILTICILGAEALYNFNLLKSAVVEINEISNKLDINISYRLITNGTILSTEILDFLSQNNFFITISLDGDEIYQNSLRPFRNGSPTFNDIKLNLMKLSKSNLWQNIYIRATLTNKNCRIDDLAKTFNELGVKTLNFKPVSLNNDKYNLSLNEDGFTSFYKSFERLSASNFIQKNSFNILPLIKRIYALQTGLFLGKECSCLLGSEYQVVTQKGDIYPCHRIDQYKQFRIGNIFDGINNNKLDKWKKIFNKIPEKCNSCWLKDFCDGGCTANNLIKSNFTNNIDLNWCQYQKVLLMAAIGILISNTHKKDQY